MDYELCFRSLRNHREVLRFPCDEAGRADMDGMDRAMLNNYLYARALLGLDFSMVLVPAHSFDSHSEPSSHYATASHPS